MSEDVITWQAALQAAVGRKLEESYLDALGGAIREEFKPKTMAEIAKLRMDVKTAVRELGRIAVPVKGFKTIDSEMIISHIKAARNNPAVAEQEHYERLRGSYDLATTPEERWTVICRARNESVSRQLMEYGDAAGHDMSGYHAKMRMETAKLIGASVKSVSVPRDGDGMCGSCVAFAPGKDPKLGKCSNGWIGQHFGKIHKDSWVRSLFLKTDNEVMVGREFGCRYYKQKAVEA